MAGTMVSLLAHPQDPPVLQTQPAGLVISTPPGRLARNDSQFPITCFGAHRLGANNTNCGRRSLGAAQEASTVGRMDHGNVPPHQRRAITLRDAILIGLAQAVALIPGISRSGATIVMAMLLGIKQESALRFSFFLFIPISLGVTILDGPELFTNPETRDLFGPLILAFIASYALIHSL